MLCFVNRIFAWIAQVWLAFKEGMESEASQKFLKHGRKLSRSERRNDFTEHVCLFQGLTGSMVNWKHRLKFKRSKWTFFFIPEMVTFPLG